MTTILGSLAVLGVLATYAHLGRTGHARPFHLANVLGAAVLAPINVMAGVYPTAVLSVTFGVIGARSLWRERA